MTTVIVHGEQFNLWLRGSDRCVRGLRTQAQRTARPEQQIPAEYGAFIGGEMVTNDRKLEDGDVVQFFPVSVNPLDANETTAIQDLMVRVTELEKRNAELEATVQRLLTDDTVALRKEL